MRRRKFITLISGAAAWPLAAHALQAAQPRLVGVLMGFAETDASRALVGDFRGELANAGWKEGDNLRIELRWGGGDVDRIGDAARELVACGLMRSSLRPLRSPPRLPARRTRYQSYS
jgi:putative ABC transport system substrate-binding protein